MARHRLFRPTEWNRRTILFYVLFQGVHIALFGYGWYKQKADNRLRILNELKYSVWLSRGAALALTLDASLLVMPMCRECLKILRPRMRWIALHDSQWFHRQVAYSLLFYTMIHCGSHYVNFFNVAKLKLRPVTAVQIHYTQVGGITGHVMLLCMLLQFTIAHSKIRQQSYQSFWKIHHLFIVFFLALLTHGTGCFVRDTKQPYSPFAGKVFWDHCIGYQSFRWELIPLTIYLFERLYRIYRSRQSAKVLDIIRHTPKLLEVRFEKKGLEYKPGQWLFVQFPDIVNNEWHPFTISTCPQDPYVSIHIQQSGDFTISFGQDHDRRRESHMSLRANVTDISQKSLEEGQQYPRIRIDGPHTSPAEDVFKHEVSVMVGAGIGVTPWVSILKAIWQLRNDPEASAKCKLKRVEFIWVCKDILDYKWLHTQIVALEKQSLELNSQGQRWPILRSRIFITRKINPALLEHIEFPVAVDIDQQKKESETLGAKIVERIEQTVLASPDQEKTELKVPNCEYDVVSTPSSPTSPLSTSSTNFFLLYPERAEHRISRCDYTISSTPSSPTSPLSTSSTSFLPLIPEKAEHRISRCDYTISSTPSSPTSPTSPISPLWPLSPISTTTVNPLTTTTASSPIMSGSKFQAQMLHGKPDFVYELTNLTRELVQDGFATTKTGRPKTVKAGLFYCGPNGSGSAGKSLRDACEKVSNKDVVYQFWKEYG